MTSTVSERTEEKTSTPEADVGDVVDGMIKIRNRMNERKREFEAAQKTDRERWERGEAWLLKHLQDQGLSNFGTSSHTVYQSERLMASVGDRSALIEHIQKSGEFDLLENRVSSKTVKQYMEDHNGDVPPGVATFTKRAINISKK